jgi:hypothetical protein
VEDRPKGEVVSANGFEAPDSEKGLAHGSSDAFAPSPQVGREGAADCERRFAKDCSSSIVEMSAGNDGERYQEVKW